MTKLITGLFLLILLGLMACQEPVDSIVIPYKAQMVVECYLNPSDPFIQVNIRSNEPMLGSAEPAVISNATVTITDDQQTVTLPFRTNAYQIGVIGNPRLRLRTGVTYTLRASAPGYDPIEATCTLPVRTTDIRWQLDGIQHIQDDRSFRVYHNYLLVWGATIPTQPQYFAIGRQWAYADTVQTTSGRDSIFNGIQTVWDHFETSEVIRTSRLHVRTFVGRVTEQDSLIKNPRSTDLLLFQCDINAYNFLKASQIQKQNGSNPFAEPSLVPSTIKNGLGVFGVVYQRRQTVP